MKTRKISKPETIALIRRAIRAGFQRKIEVMRLPQSGRFAVIVFLFHKDGCHVVISFRGLAPRPLVLRKPTIAIVAYHYGAAPTPARWKGIDAAFEQVRTVEETRAA